MGGYQTVIGFLKLLPSVISFGAAAEGAPVLAAMRALPEVLAYAAACPRRYQGTLWSWPSQRGCGCMISAIWPWYPTVFSRERHSQ